MKRFFAFLVATLLASPAFAQARDLMHVVLKDDRLELSNGEFVPRFTKYLERVKEIGIGQVYTAPPDSLWDAVEVQSGGELIIPPGATFWFTHLIVLPGGKLTIIAPCGTRTELVVRNVPIDLKRDPFQWGNGLLVFGKQVRVGCEMSKTWLPTTGDLQAGDTTIELAEDPAALGWHLNDALEFPDLRSARRADWNQPPLLRREQPITIKAIDGKRITLSKPLDFEHLAIRKAPGAQNPIMRAIRALTPLDDPKGEIVLLPRVVNFTRNLVIRSEDPTGTPGHTATLGHEASWLIKFNEFRGLGRTKVVKLDNTSLDLAHIGTNQIGKYADHYHHTQGLDGLTFGNSYTGHETTKWALVLHRTSDAHAEWNVARDFLGGAFITEDGDEVRNVLRYNLGLYITGGPSDGNDPFGHLTMGLPGTEGAVFWNRGMHLATLQFNESYNSNYGFMQMLNVDGAGRFASVPGGPLDTPFPSQAMAPAAIADNVTVANIHAGVDFWSPNAPYSIERHLSANNFFAQVKAGPTSPNVRFVESTVICDQTDAGVEVHKPYVGVLEWLGGYIGGCRYGLIKGGGNVRTIFRNVVMANTIDFNYSDDVLTAGELVIDSVRRPNGDGPIIHYGPYLPFRPTASDDISTCRQYVLGFDGKDACLSTPRPKPARDPFNAALEANGATAAASSVFWASVGDPHPHHEARNLINGDDRGADFDSFVTPLPWSGVWIAGDAKPDWIVVQFKGETTIDSVTAVSVQDDKLVPQPVTDALTFTSMGVVDFDVEAWDGEAWHLVPNGQVRDNDRIARTVSFPPLTTSQIRILPLRMVGRNRAAFTEIKAHALEALPPSTPDPNPPPPPDPPPPPPDGDGDGVPDAIDQCPTQPQGPAAGGLPGCPPPPPVDPPPVDPPPVDPPPVDPPPVDPPPPAGDSAALEALRKELAGVRDELHTTGARLLEAQARIAELEAQSRLKDATIAGLEIKAAKLDALQKALEGILK